MPNDWDQSQTSIWLQKCLSNPAIYETDIDHTRCKCCGKIDIITKRKGRKKKAIVTTGLTNEEST